MAMHTGLVGTTTADARALFPTGGVVGRLFSVTKLRSLRLAGRKNNLWH